MNIRKWTKGSFAVIGKQGSTEDGNNFIQKLWENANASFAQVSDLAKKDENGNIVGVWGAMSDESLRFMPWDEDFSKGLYLAGVECVDEAQPPEGWTKWMIPGFEYLCMENDHETVFREMIEYLRENDIPLAGAVQDFTCPKTGKGYMLFPIKRL